jgi:hypothetical protein
MRRSRFRPPVDLGRSAFSGYRFPPEVIILAVRWYLRYGLSYRDLEELLEGAENSSVGRPPCTWAGDAHEQCDPVWVPETVSCLVRRYFDARG